MTDCSCGAASSASSTARSIESIVHVARALSVETVGEWVDNVETAELLRDIGVDYLQGFGFGRPAPLEELLAAPEEVSTTPSELGPPKDRR